MSGAGNPASLRFRKSCNDLEVEVGSENGGGSAAWATWVAFAGVMLMLIGVFSVIAGLAALFEDDLRMP